MHYASHRLSNFGRLNRKLSEVLSQCMKVQKVFVLTSRFLTLALKFGLYSLRMSLVDFARLNFGLQRQYMIIKSKSNKGSTKIAHYHTGKCICRFAGIYVFCRYFIDRKWQILVLILYIEKHSICLKDYRIRSFLSIQYVHGDLCKYLGIYPSTDLDDWYSNLFLNAYINCHVRAKNLKMI